MSDRPTASVRLTVKSLELSLGDQDRGACPPAFSRQSTAGPSQSRGAREREWGGGGHPSELERKEENSRHLQVMQRYIQKTLQVPPNDC